MASRDSGVSGALSFVAVAILVHSCNQGIPPATLQRQAEAAERQARAQEQQAHALKRQADAQGDQVRATEALTRAVRQLELEARCR